MLGPEELAGYRQACRQPGALTGMINWYRSLLKHRFGPLDPYRHETPVLFAYGEEDPYLAPATAKLSAGLGPHIKAVPLAGHGHWLIHEDPCSVRLMIEGFLSEQAAAPRASHKLTI